MPQVDVPDSHYKGPVSPAVERITGGIEGLRSTNPKDRIGITKPPIHLVPAVATIHEAMAFKDGAEKYGPYNWRDESVSASVYIAAAYRHIMAWYDREEFAQDSGAHHLGHARACLAIILDAMSVEKLVDDRPYAGQSAKLLSSLSTSEKGNANEYEQGQQSEGSPHSTDRR